MKTICLVLGLGVCAVVFLMGAITSSMAIYYGDMSGWSFWIGAGIAALIVYGQSRHK